METFVAIIATLTFLVLLLLILEPKKPKSAEEYKRLHAASKQLYVAAAKRMTVDNPTAEQRIEMLRAWKAVGDIVDPPTTKK